MTEFDPAKLVAALRKAMEKVEALTKKVEFLEEQNGKRARMEDELGRHLTSLRTQMQERAGSFEAVICAGLQDLMDMHVVDASRLRDRLQGQEENLLRPQAFVIGHEVTLIGLTGQETELPPLNGDAQEVTAGADSAAMKLRSSGDLEIEEPAQPRAA